MECGEMTTWNKLVQCRWQLLVLTAFWNEVVTVNINNACSARTDGTCVRCDGVPQCFDLSDEIGCTNTTINLAPVKQAARRCAGNGCVDRFPRPPPLPPFSLCKHAQKTLPTIETTANAPEMSTTTTTGVTTYPNTKDMTTTIEQSNEKAAQTTTLRTELTTKPTTTQTQVPVTTSTQSTPRSTTTCTKTRSTNIPVLSTTQWLPMTTSRPEPIFMAVWRSCSTIYYRLEDTNRCVVRYYCFRNRNCFQPLRVIHSTKIPRAHPGNTVNNRHTVKTKPKVIPSRFSKQTSSLHISRKDRKGVFPTMSQKTQMLGPKIERTTQPFYPTRKPYLQTPRQLVLTPVTERQLKQIPRTSESLQKSDSSSLFPKTQRRYMNRNPAIFNKQSFPLRATRPTTMGQWYRTTVLPYTATPMATPTLEPFYNPNFDQYGTTNPDLMYALMVLQHF